jgi:integrase
MARKSTSHRRAWGQIRRLPSGNYQASYLGPDGCRYTADTTYTTRSRAEGWLADERRLIENRDWTPPKIREATQTAKAVALGDYAEQWLAHRPIKERTRVHYRTILHTHITPQLGDVPLGYLTAPAVRAWHASTAESAATLRAHAYGLLHAICATAVDDGLLAANPCTIRGASRAHPQRDPVILDVAEVAGLADAITPRYRALVLILAWTGVRWGEATELRRHDVGPGAETVTVARGVTHRRGCRITGTKSDRIRRVVVPPHIRADAKHHLDTFVAADPDALLFPAPRGSVCGHLTDRTFRYHLNPALAKIGRDGITNPRPTVHGLRYYAGTQAARVGNLVEVMAILGHTTPATSLRYQHMASGRPAEVADALSALAADGRHLDPR